MFEYIPRLAMAQISDYLVIPKNVSGSKSLELIITDPTEGLHLVTTSAKPGSNIIYLKEPMSH